MAKYEYERICMEECSEAFEVGSEEYFKCVQNCMDALIGEVPVRTLVCKNS